MLWDLRYPDPQTLPYGYYGNLLTYTEYTLTWHAVKGHTPRVQPPGPIAIPGTYHVELKVAHLTTVDSSLRYLLYPQLTAVRDRGGDILGISAPGPYADALAAEGIRHVPLGSSTRSMNPSADLRSAVELWRVLRRERPDVADQLVQRVPALPGRKIHLGGVLLRAIAEVLGEIVDLVVEFAVHLSVDAEILEERHRRLEAGFGRRRFGRATG